MITVYQNVLEKPGMKYGHMLIMIVFGETSYDAVSFFPLNYVKCKAFCVLA